MTSRQAESLSSAAHSAGLALGIRLYSRPDRFANLLHAGWQITSLNILKIYFIMANVAHPL